MHSVRTKDSVLSVSELKHQARSAHELGDERKDLEVVRLNAADGCALEGIYYRAAKQTRAHVIVAGAIGVPQYYYRRFARFAATHGYATMTVDYRGIGRSAPATLRGFHADLIDWACLDLAAAVEAMRTDDVPLYMVGHSFAGHAFGLLPNHAAVSKFYTFGTGAGWHGWMPRVERIKVLAMWHGLGPLLTAGKGYLAWSRVGLGADLPLDVYRQWKRWCRHPNFFFGDQTVCHLTRRFECVHTPIMAVNSIDDRWSPPASRDAFMAGYKNAALKTLDIDPSQLGLRKMGHMGYFKTSAVPLWRRTLEWFEQGKDHDGRNAYSAISDVPSNFQRAQA